MASSQPLRYISTRGEAPALNFADVLLAGLASDGGLYVPEAWPPLSQVALPQVASPQIALSKDTLPEQTAQTAPAPAARPSATSPPASTPSAAVKPPSYPAFAAEVMWPFVAGAWEKDDFAALIADAYSSFSHPEVAPLVPLGDPADNIWLMELFWGPTLAFKDIALQLLGRFFDAELKRRSGQITIVGATSGDTGSAAIEACRDRDTMDIFILHPHERVSEVQRRQMTTVDSPTVHNIALRGSFDDCQDVVKALFADEALKDRLQLSAINSINWARVMAQIVYYIWAAVKLGVDLGGTGVGEMANEGMGRGGSEKEGKGISEGVGEGGSEGEEKGISEEVGRGAGGKASSVEGSRSTAGKISFAVPTGNFGNVYAGYGASGMGLDARLIVGTNRNDSLARFFSTATLATGEVSPTLSPSMDIMIPSNLERLIFDIFGRDSKATADFMQQVRHDGTATVPADRFSSLGDVWTSRRTDDPATLEVIGKTYRDTGRLIDPHTAVGLAAAQELHTEGEPTVVLATAHPAKFPDAVKQATGITPDLPDSMADLHERTERYAVLDNDLAAVRRYIEEHARLG